MNKLFKNAFFSFFKNKLAIALLMIIVFLTTATFTMFNSATHAFQKSYDQVMTEGNRHEYTIKELYNIEGDAVFTDPQKEGTTYSRQALDAQNTHIANNGTDDLTKSMRVVTYKGQNYFAFVGKVGVTTDSDTFFGKFTAGANQVFMMTENDFSRLVQAKNTDVTLYVAEGATSLATAPTISGISYSVKTRIDIDSTATDKLDSTFVISTGSFNTEKIFVDTPKAEFAKLMKSAITNAYPAVDFQKYSFGLDTAKSGAIFNKLNQINNYKFELAVPASVTTPDFTSQVITTVNSEFNATSLSEYKDKLRSHLNDSARFEMHNQMIKKITTYPELLYKDVESVKVSYNTQTFKFVNETKSDVDKIKIFEGTTLPDSIKEATLWENYKNYLIDLMMDGKLDQIFAEQYMKVIDGQTDTYNKFYTGWSVLLGNSQETVRYIDPTSFAAVVSPTYADNADQKIVPMSKADFDKITTDKEFIRAINDSTKTYTDIDNAMKKILGEDVYKKSVLHAGSTPYFVVGKGITPDFAFPIISADSPIPNTSTQAIIYTNASGYARIKQANAGAPVENYIALGFKDGTSQDRKDQIVSEMDQYAQSQTSWPRGIKALEKYDSSNETVILAPQRIQFLQTLNHTISTVSWIVTSLLVLFTAFIVSLVIKKQIDNRKKQLGILLANGYSKLEIASSMMVIGLIVAVIPALIGYLVGHFSQFILMNTFHNYWTLPIWETQFNWITLVVTVVAPLAGMALLAFIISLFALRGRIPEILAGETNKNGAITRYLMKPTKWFGIKTKMGMSLVFSNIGKLAIAFVAFGASIIALSVSINSVGKFNYARDKSEQATSYEYQIDLTTPTVEGGLYTAQTLDSIYYDSKTAAKESFSYAGVRASMQSLVESDADHHDDGMFFHAASVADMKFAAPSVAQDKFYFPQYLKNRIQVKSLLNFNVSGDTNPWRIASQMMPENQKNIADTKENEFLTYAIEKYRTSKDASIQQKWAAAIDSTNKQSFLELQSNGDYALTTNLNKLTGSNLAISDEFLDFYSYGLYNAVTDYLAGNTNTPLPYFMVYNNVIIDKTDETFTHIDIDFDRENVNGKEKVQPLKIRGIDQTRLEAGKSQIKLSSTAISALKNANPKTNGDVVPIVINKYFKEFYNLNIGDTFSNLITNKSDRFISTNTAKTTFKVVAVEDTYNDSKVYTLQNYANDVLGLTALSAKNPMMANSKSVAFNGVMTTEDNKNPIIFNSLPLYSPSGLYPGKNMISSSNKGEDGYMAIDKSYFNPDPAWAASPVPGKQALTFPNPNVTNMDQLMKTYGTGSMISPMQSMYSTVDWTAVSDFQFNSIMNLASALMNTVQAIVMFIALAFVLLISTMIIADNTRFIATLKVMGYRTREISKIFLATFIPSLILALIVSVPIVFGLEEAIRVGIMGFGHVLIPLYIVGWEIALAFAILVIGFLAMYFISLRGLKNTSLLKAFQE